MQAEMTFSENTIGRKTADRPKILSIIKRISALQDIIEKTDWDKSVFRFEKYLNRFSWTMIIVSLVFFIPVCLNIFIH